MKEIRITEQDVRKDLQTGDGRIFDKVIEAIQRQTDADTDIFDIGGSQFVQVDVGIEEGKKTRTRLHLRKAYPDLSSQNYISVWQVEGRQGEEKLGESIDYMNYRSQTKPNSHIAVSREGSLDGWDEDVSPGEFARRLDETLSQINPYNWRLHVGLRNVPEGEL